MIGRNRPEGWKHAKLSGHDNERIACSVLQEDAEFRRKLLLAAGLEDEFYLSCDYGGKGETLVDSVLGGTKTKSKTDLRINFLGKKRVNFSLKKSLGGQVYLLSTHHFIRGYQIHYSENIPIVVQEAIQLFWGQDLQVPNIHAAYPARNAHHRILEQRHSRLSASTLLSFSSQMYDALLDWFCRNTGKIADFCFSRGLAKQEREWADFVWYKNFLGENAVDSVISLPQMCDALQRNANLTTSYGVRNGGTTINLAFGFVQWHQAKMQFHHDYDKICAAVGK